MLNSKYQSLKCFILLGLGALILIGSKMPVHGQEGENLKGLNVDESGHYLVSKDGKPFFWLGDTAWELFSKLNQDEVLKYLWDRKNKQFNVIQARIIGLQITQPNAFGHTAFDNGDLDQPNEDYWQHADFIIKQAEELELYMALLPAWSKAHVENKGKSDVGLSLNPKRAYRYGLFLGERYKNSNNIIWILGGDVQPTKHKVYDELARGIIEGYGQENSDNLLMSYHPPGGTFRPPATSSGEFYHDKPWLDFNMIQSGHRLGNKNYERITEDFQRTPVKPTIDSEPGYEKHPILHNFKNGQFSAWHLRRRAYWSILAGGFGFSYGGNGIWQMDQPGNIKKFSHHNFYWYDALHYEGAYDMAHVRRLFESRPFIQPTRIPDQSILISAPGTVDDRVQAARSDDYSYWIVYITNGRTIKLDLSQLSGTKINAWWFNPRDGLIYDSDLQVTGQPFAVFSNEKRQTFDPPEQPKPENDWILILDDASQKYPVPGLTSSQH